MELRIWIHDGWYSVANLQDNPSTNIYVNKIEERIIFKTKAGHYPKLFIASNTEITWNH